VQQLPPRNAKLFEMHYRDGYLCDELANRFEMHTGTVKSRLHRIRVTLQKQLQAA
jgi:DNA-directed RNA polymerase specialized sigma24 family protein